MEESFVKIKSFYAEDYSEFHDFVTEFLSPDYTDNILEEHLYSVNFSSVKVEKTNKKLIEELKNVINICEKNDCSYFRFLIH